jgi:hypothetical protein
MSRWAIRRGIGDIGGIEAKKENARTVDPGGETGWVG